MRGNNDAALAEFLKAVDALERDRRTLRGERSRGTFLEDRINFYYAPVQQLLERRRYDQAFELVERSRSRALADLLASRAPGLQNPEEQKAYAELMVLRAKIANAQGALFERPDDGKQAAKSQAIQKQLRALEAQDADVSRRLQSESPRLHSLVASPPASLAAFQRRLRDEGYEALQYLVLEHAVLVWHISPDAVSVRNVFLPRSEMIGKVAALRKSLADPNVPFDETTARELFLYLLGPVLPHIHAERLVILPHEDLHYVPFQVLQDPADRRYAGERFQIAYAPSASVLLELKRSAGLKGGRLLAIADPDLRAGPEEVAEIAKLFPGQSRVLSDSLAREHDVKGLVREFDVIHLAVHGTFDGGEPLLSYIELSSGDGDDGRLTAAEMFGLPLANSRLVVLSACETGRAEATHANELLGMVRALIYAGAGTLVLSHWQVQSAATSRWMQAFYEAGRSGTLADAARTALLAVKAAPEYRHPHYWAAFTMIGR
jgi:CHAT domain-containing protein